MAAERPGIAAGAAVAAIGTGRVLFQWDSAAHVPYRAYLLPWHPPG